MLVQAGNGDIYLVTHRFEPARISASNDLAQILGHRGADKDGHQLTFAVATSGDTVTFYDAGLKRVTEFLPGHTEPILRPFATVPFGDIVSVGARRFVNASVRTADRIGFPLHEVDSTGRAVRSFGPVAEVDPRAAPWAQRLRLRPTRGSPGFWAIYQTQYVIDRYGPRGDFVGRLSRDVDWFPRGRPFELGDSTTPPSPLVLDARQDSIGRLWVLVRLADRHWSRGVRRAPPVHGHSSFAVGDYDRAYDTIIEVIDPSTERVLASSRYDLYFGGFLEDGLLWRYSAGRRNAPILQTWRATYRDRP